MSGVFEIKSLQELCLTHIIMTLEQFSTDVLSLLPKKFREQLLCNLPVLDVCRLEEDSSFTAGIDMDSLWKEIFRFLMHNRYKCGTTEIAWRELLFEQLLSIIIQGDRPYGYFDILSQRTRYIQVNNLGMTKNQPVHKSLYIPLHIIIKRDEMGLVNFPVPLAPSCTKFCCINQLVPPRYAKLFPEGSCCLPDSTVLQLITEKCHFRPKQLHIDVSTFVTLLLNIEKECGGVECLKHCFGDVEFVSIQGSQQRRYINAIEYKECEHVVSQVLDLILQSSNPVLANLTVGLSTVDNVLESIEPALVRYGGLTKFTLNCHGVNSLNFLALGSIIKHQALLKSVSISEHILYHSDSLSHAFYDADFLFLVQTCFENPSLEELKLTLYQPSAQLVLQVIAVFLSTPCSREQTLSINLTLGSRPTPHLSAACAATRCDDALTLKYKCLSFNLSKLGNSFLDAFLQLAPLKVKKMSFQGSVDPKFLTRLILNPLIEMESLELFLSDLPDQNKEFFNLLSQKEFLKSVWYNGLNENTQIFDNSAATFEHVDTKCVSNISEEKTFVLCRI